jgi:hypothetical protein
LSAASLSSESEERDDPIEIHGSLLGRPPRKNKKAARDIQKPKCRRASRPRVRDRTRTVFLKPWQPKPRKKLRTGSLQHGLMLVGELDENIFAAESEWTNFCDGNTVLITDAI